MAVSSGSAVLQKRSDGTHLWFVLTDPDKKTGKVVAVMLVTATQNTDKTVALAPGDHPFIKRESNVSYGSAQFFTAEILDANIQAGLAKQMPDMSPVLLKKVRDGLLNSSRTAHYMTDYCRPIFSA